jgi:hypothetical protein
MGKLILSVVRILPLWAVVLVLPGIVTSQSPCPVLFSDNFDNGIGSEWIRERGGFHMAAGQLTNAGPRGTLWLGKKDWTDVVVEFDATGTACGGEDYVTILLRMQDTLNWVGVVVATEICMFHNPGGIYVIKNGEQTTLIQKGGSSGYWRIEAVGNVWGACPTPSSPGSEVGPGKVATWSKATANQVDAHEFQRNWAGQSSKHVPFDWTGPA